MRLQHISDTVFYRKHLDEDLKLCPRIECKSNGDIS